MIKVIKNRAGIVTGVGKGIGYSITSNLLKDGYTVYGLNKSNNSKINNLKKKYPKNFIFYKLNINNFLLVKKTMREIFKKNNSIKFLINNAGVRSRFSINELKDKEILRVMNVNFISQLKITKQFLKLCDHKKNSIIMISSIVGNLGFKNLSNYASSKGALEAFAKSAAVEYAELGIRINCIAPGFIKTSYFNNFKKNNKKLYDWTLSRIPMKRWGDADEVYPMVEFLVSDKSSYITGSTFYVDGGWTHS